MSTVVKVQFFDDADLGENIRGTLVKEVAYNTLDLTDGQEAFSRAIKTLDEWSAIL